MLGQLLESSPKHARRHYSAIVSFVGHAIVLSGAVAAARPVSDTADPQTIITWHPLAPPPPPPCTECSTPTRSGSGKSRGLPRVPPTQHGLGEIAIDLPSDVDAITDGVEISAEEWQGGMTGRESGRTDAGPERAIVDREVVPFSTNPAPRYPAELRAAHIEGRVLARFVVDTTGRVIMRTVNVEAADHPAFGVAVIDALRQSRFQPAEFRGRRVQQLVSQPFVFLLRDGR
jgi:periplasmic protein TonB